MCSHPALSRGGARCHCLGSRQISDGGGGGGGAERRIHITRSELYYPLFRQILFFVLDNRLPSRKKSIYCWASDFELDCESSLKIKKRYDLEQVRNLGGVNKISLGYWVTQFESDLEFRKERFKLRVLIRKMENLSNQAGWILSRQHPAAATNKLSPDEKVWIIK